MKTTVIEQGLHRVPLWLLTIFAAVSASSAQDAPADNGGVAAGKPVELISPETFSTRAFMTAPILSPDGDRIAARMESGGGSVLAAMKLFDTQDGAKRGLHTVNTDITLSFDWISNDLLLVESASFKMKVGKQLLIYNFVTEERRFLTIEKAHMGNVVYVDPAGQFLLVSATGQGHTFPSVYRIEIATGAATEIVKPVVPVRIWQADANGVVRLGTGTIGAKRKFVYRDAENDKFETVADFRWQEWDTDLESSRARGVNVEQGFIVNNARTGRFGVYAFNWKTFEVGAPIYEHPQVDIDGIWTNRTGDLLAVLLTDERPRVIWLDPRMQGLQKEIDNALQGRSNVVVSKDDSLTKFIVLTSAPEDPGHYYYFDRRTGVMKRIASPMEALRGKPLAPMLAFTFQARDGLQIPAYLTVPVGIPRKNLPLIVMPHGGPHARDTWQYSPDVQFLANRGYAVLQPNFRGSTGYGRDYLEKGYGQWGGAMQDDLDDGVVSLVRDGVVDPKRVCIMGASYGGYAALMGAIKSPHMYRCAISFAGVTDVSTILSRNPLFRPPSRYARALAKLEGEEQANLKSVSPVRLADRVGAPILLAHGTGDGRVPFAQAIAMTKALQKSGKEFEFVEFKGLGHGFVGREKDFIRFMEAVEVFLRKHNPSDRMLAVSP